MKDVATVFDRLDLRCPRLGGSVTFDYCRKVSEGLPCSRSLLCWAPQFPVMEYMIRVLDSDEWQQVFEQPAKPRLSSVLEAVERAREAAEAVQMQ
jgi:hypothetical protein